MKKVFWNIERLLDDYLKENRPINIDLVKFKKDFLFFTERLELFLSIYNITNKVYKVELLNLFTFVKIRISIRNECYFPSVLNIIGDKNFNKTSPHELHYDLWRNGTLLTKEFHQLRIFI